MSAGLCLRHALTACVLASLVGCATAPMMMTSRSGDAGLLADQAAREQVLQKLDHWQLQGRLGISDGHDAPSGSLRWMEQGASYVFNVSGGFGPFAKNFRLSGGPGGAVLDGLDSQPLHGASAEMLMLRAVGWSVPMDELRAWVRGARASGTPAKIRFGDDRLPASIEQDGWQIQYPAWDTTVQPAMPSKVFASKPPYMVRLSIQSWQSP